MWVVSWMNKAIANQPWAALLLVFGSGVAMGLTTAPTNWWILAWVAQVPLWVLVYGDQQSRQREQGRQTDQSKIQNPKSKIQNSVHPILAAVLWSIGYYGTTLSWITGLHPLTWMGIPWVASVAIASTCWLLIVLWGCVWGGFWAMGLSMVSQRWLPMSQTFGFARVLVGTALWCGLDTLWNHGILYWPTFALTQSPHNLWLLQLNQLSGPMTTTAVIVAVNGLIA
ncbi:MAG: apolipoprotein N-acyltransferase, partial [Merismopedia sp. SIO2A8]|nr:apolipoprotein N-acyltransferase [Merismopedia sp. SIO2A8]